MLDFLLVLGQIPGTHFYFTFTEVMIFLLIVFLRWEEKIRHKQIVRWLKWAKYRTGVNYRRSKRIIRSYIRYKRYRLAVWERKVKRNVRRNIRRTRYAIILAILRTKRQIKLAIRRSYRNSVNSVAKRIRRTKRYIRTINQANLSPNHNCGLSIPAPHKAKSSTKDKTNKKIDYLQYLYPA
jgi:hypothetical protein